MNEVNASGGALRGDCPWYVERREDSLVLDRLVRGKGCYVLTSHQMGKSSLVVRLMDNFRENGFGAAAIDLAAIGRELNASQWYNALSLRVAQQLDLEDELDAFCTTHKDLPPFECFSQALAHIALRFQPSPLIVFVDEADLLRSLPFSPDEFLGAVHDAASSPEEAGTSQPRLAYCLFATVSPAALWRQPRGSSELGHVIALRDFGRDELFGVLDGVARCLLHRNELPTSAFLPELTFVLGKILERIFHWTHGQPYLTQKLGCAATQWLERQLSRLDDITAAQCHQVVDALCEALFTGRTAPDQDCHLLWVRHSLLNCGLDARRIVEILQCIRHGIPPTLADDNDAERLIRTGAVCAREGRLELRNRIYDGVFEAQWLCNGLRADWPLPVRSRFSATTPINAETPLANSARLLNLALCPN